MADYLLLPEGQTTSFTIDFFNTFKFVHFITDHAGQKRKKLCAPYTCVHCANGSRRCMRLSMSVIHNGDTKILEVGSALGHQIINLFSVGDTLTIERRGTGFATTYNIIGIPSSGQHSVQQIQTTNPTYSGDREEGIKELIYDVQRTNDYQHKYDLIKDFARKY